jgi:uncharacterized protein YndB with AHSA1/START domain
MTPTDEIAGKLNDTTSSKLIVSTPSDRQIRMERVFDAPRELVYRAFTEPELVPRWWGFRTSKTVVDKMEVRPGGSWRYVQVSPDGTEHAFRGEYLELRPPERITWTFEYEPMPGHILVESMTFEAIGVDRTRAVTLSTFDTTEERDGMLQSGMETGATESYERLAELLATL